MNAANLQSEARESGISAVIPTLNESENITSLLPRLAVALGKGGIPWEVILVDDGSPDGTADLAEDMASQLDVDLRAIRRSGPRSLGLSVIEGARLAKHGVIVVLDADMTHDPKDAPRVVEPVLAGRADLAIGSRYAPGGRIRDWPARRRFLSSINSQAAINSSM